VRAAFVAVALLLGLLTACSAPVATTNAPAPAGPPIAATQQARTAPEDGYAVSVPKIGMTSSLIPLGLNADKTIQVPPLDQVEQAGYYAQGPKPGQPGPAVILCHVNGGGKPGCGARFAELNEGDKIEISTPTQGFTFTVYKRQTVTKSNFPTSAVYSDTPGPELRLITCGPGAVVGHDYVDQTIVYAKL
jgi:sortase (surface protein transpeptidase)